MTLKKQLFTCARSCLLAGVAVLCAFTLQAEVAPKDGGNVPVEREMVIEKAYLRFPKQFFPVAKEDSLNQHTIDFVVDGKIARREKLSMADEKPDYWAYLDVSEFKGRKVVLKADGLPGNSKALKNIFQSDVALDAKDIYREPHRPQFHYTMRRGWLNDPNGLLFYKGEYHLCYQTFPLGTGLGGYAHWGHAISSDLVHWTEYPMALYPGENGHVFSGSGVVDWNNTTGFKTGPDDPLVVAYDNPNPGEQAIAYSNDRGRTWTKYDGNPVLPRFAKNNGDPKIFWYAPTKRWIMICTFPKENYGFFSSPNLKDWKLEQSVYLQGFECPDFFPMTVEGQTTRKWVLTTNPLTYFTGDFDGHIFKPDSETGQRLDWGFSYHSAQTFNEMPESDGRRIQIAWMQDVAGDFYHQTLFNQQLSFPTALTLHAFPEGLRVCRQPIREIEKLRVKEHSWRDLTLNPGENPIASIKGDLFEIRAEIEVGNASDVGFSIRGVPINYSVKDRKLSLFGNNAPMEQVAGRIALQILVDRTSLEVFGNGGRVSITSYFSPKDDVKDIGVFSRNGSAKVVSLEVFELRSIWTQADNAQSLASASGEHAAPTPRPTPSVTGVPIKGRPAGQGKASEVLSKGDNNEMRLEETDGLKAWVAVPSQPSSPRGLSAYFKAPEYLRNLSAPHGVRVELIYFDRAAGQYHLSYDSQDARCFSSNKEPGAGKPLPTLVTTGSGGWKSVWWILPDPRFGGNLNGADLKLAGDGALPLIVLGLFIDSVYDLTDDSKPHLNVPKGDILQFKFDQSKIFPGTTRNVTVYVPKQYDGAKPACVWVDQDGMNWNDATVLDNLIARKEVPIIIDIAISPGTVEYPGKDALGRPGQKRGNRQFEYDVMSDDYVRFLIEEIFPAVERQKTQDGRALKLSRDGNDCGISGASSGGICALNAAWQRPDAFTRVLSAIGSFDNLHGGDRFPGLIRKTEPKPIRVFLQDGCNDLNWFAGDWFLANQRMDRALEWAGYEHTQLWGDRGHDAAQAVCAFPDVLRYLWKDWPAPVKTGKVDFFRNTFGDNKAWQQVWEGKQAPPGLAVNAKGEVFFNDASEGKCYRIDAGGAVTPFLPTAKGDAGMAFGSDGRLYQIEAAAGRIVAYDPKGASSVIVTGIHGEGMVALPHGRFFVSEPGRNGDPSRIWLVGADGSKKIVDSGDYFSGPLGIDAPSYSYLSVGDSTSHWIHSCQALPDGTLQYRQRYTQLETPVIEGNPGTKGICVLPDGQVVAATQLGLQFANGSIVNGIVPVPGGAARSVVMGGPAFNIFYITSGNKIYLRKTNLHGVPPPAL